MKHKLAGTIAGVAAVLSIAGLASTADAAGQAAAPAWRTVYQLAQNGEFDGVVATGKTSGFAFFDSYTTVAVPVAYERTGATAFKKVSFPTVADEFVVGAGGTTLSDVYVFADILTLSSARQESQVLKWTGKKFSVVSTFSGWLNGGTVLSAGDVFAYGGTGPSGTGRSAGVYHYNGHKWTKLSATVSGNGDALSAANAYVADGTSVAHYDNGKWTTTSLAGLLPKKTENPRLARILALSADSVYAVGDGGSRADLGGPVVIVHYNGRTWSKVASYRVGIVGGAPAADGKGGLWLPLAETGRPAPGLLHYSDGKLTVVALPKFDGGSIAVDSVSRIPGTAAELAGGVVPYPVGKTYHPAVIIQYS